MATQRVGLAQRIGRGLQRWSSSFVMEAECDDGTRLLIGLDAGWHGAPTIALIGHDDRWTDRWTEALVAHRT